MKYRIFGAITFTFLFAFSQLVLAQTTKSKSKSSSGEKQKSEKMTIIIDGDNVTINGKPVTEYDGENIVIRKKNIEKAIAPYVYSAPRVSVHPRIAQRAYPVAPSYDFNFEFDHDMLASKKPRAQLGVVTESDDKGVRIKEVMKESAAAKAGLAEGDIITTVSGKNVDDPEELADVINDKDPGEEVEIAYIRNKKTQKVKVKLGESKVSANRRPSNPPRTQFYFNDDAIPHALDRMQGFGFRNDGVFNFSRGPRLGIRIEDTEDSKGARILYVEEESVAEKAGLKKDDIINSIDTLTVKDTDDAIRALGEMREKQNFSIGVQRSGSPVKVEVKIPKQLRKTDL
jgi:serine protease Do